MITIPNPIASTALARPAHEVLIDDDGALSAAALLTAVKRRAAFFATRGIRPRHKVALFGEPCRDWVISLHALGWLGATVAPLPQSPEALTRALAILKPKLIVASRDLQGGRANAPVIAPDEDSFDVPERCWPMHESRLLVLTSGTTGRPRMVRLTTAQLVFNAFGSAIRLGLDINDRWLLCLPLDHVGGLAVLWRSAFYATSIRLLTRFCPVRVNQLIDNERITLISLVPTMLKRLLDERGDKPFPHSLRAVLLGGAAAHPALIARSEALGAPLALSFGMTETASQIATTYPGDYSRRGDVGPPLCFARVEADEGGRLMVYGPLTKTGSLRTNDLGEVDRKGRVRVRGRSDDLIIRGGQNIDPIEIEHVLTQHPDIAQAAVVGVPDDELGERVVAFVALRPGAKIPDPDCLRHLCAAKLPRYCVPSCFVTRERLDTTGLDKLTRAILRKEAKTMAARGALP